jgi:hypothetical protein
MKNVNMLWKSTMIVTHVWNVMCENCNKHIEFYIDWLNVMD